jgi:hypothetical protein
MNPNRTRCLVAALCLALPCVATTAAPAQVRFVDDSAPPGGDGLSWTSAWCHLQDALLAAAGDPSIVEIRVAGGTYTPDLGASVTPGDRTATFRLREGLALRGGFRGAFVPGDPGDRDQSAFPSSLGGDLAGNDQPGWVNHGENSANIVTAEGVGPSAVLDGFVLTAGYAAGPGVPHVAGAALYVQSASPTVTACSLVGNLASLGAAVVVIGGSPSFSDCTFSGNHAWTGRGGAMYGASGSSLALDGCVFSGNSSYGAASVGDGGAIFLEFNSPATISRCTFSGNTASATMINFAVGGAIASLTEGLAIRHCGFWGNESQVGGAVWSGGNFECVNSAFSGNSALVGGAVMLFTAAGSFAGCSLSGNSADDGGGVSLGLGSHADLANCILWGNTATNAPSSYKAAVHKDQSSTASLSYSCVQGVFTPEPGEDPPDPADFPGCTEANPLLADANGADNVVGTDDDDLRLASGSPCADAGDNGAVPGFVTTDLDGLGRFADDPGAPDTGLGPPPIVDMGAYERQPAAVPGDANGDGLVDVADLVTVILNWGPCPATCAGDVNGDGQVDVSDLVAVIVHWTA